MEQLIDVLWCERCVCCLQIDGCYLLLLALFNTLRLIAGKF